MRHYLAAVRALVVFTVVLGVGYPLLMTGVGQVAFTAKANGSLVVHDGRVIGSTLIGQAWSDATGNPLPQWFQPRPSATDYDAATSGGSNAGPENADLIKTIRQRQRAIAAFDSVPGHAVRPADVPPDAVTASASGLDPDISPAYARQQAYRVAYTRHLDVAAVLKLVKDHTRKAAFGTFGHEAVNVLQLNLALLRLT